MAGALGESTRWLEVLAMSVFVYSVTGSALAVTLVNLIRALPNVLFGAVTGALAERIDARQLLVYGTLFAAATTGVIALLAIFGVVEVWHIAVAAFLSGTAFSTEFPVRRKLLGELAGIERIGAAMGFDSVTRTATRMVGPAVGGFLLQYVGLHGAYLLATVVYGITALLLAGVPGRAAGAGRPAVAVRTPFITNLIDGLRYVRSDRSLVGFLVVTMVMNIWGFPYMNMVPAIGHDVLGIGAFQIGLLFSVEGLGAMIGALAIAITQPARHYLRLYVLGAMLFMLAITVFSRSGSYELSLVIVLVGGLGLAGFTTMQGTLPFLLAPPELRARVLGLVAVCIGTGPIGHIHLGLMSSWFGAPLATMITGIEGLVAMVATIVFLIGPGLWRREATAAR
ncbi:MAG: MFS transporter [Alphaproteobacteria bacterium]|nr:MFS transporter [Alphaproteobacteria bacterium]